jgi:predicted transcriptional regulator
MARSFKISQTELADHLKLSPSVISDYESGRRKSPGIQTIKKIIKDEETNILIKEYENEMNDPFP